MKADAIIVSAGQGLRFMAGRKKQFFSLGGKPLLAHTLAPFEASPLVRGIYLVVGGEDIEYCQKEIVEPYHYTKIAKILPGGPERQDSVRNGLEALPPDADLVVIHDGVRPFVSREMIEESIRSAIRFGAAIVAIPVKDTIKMVHPEGTVLKTLEREFLYQAQTPQTFRTDLIKEAYQKAKEEGYTGTDDASLVERFGKKVYLLPGSYTNIKITTLEDLLLAELLLQRKDLPGGEMG
ncbi:MAG: 2-C-methyl-D-erythritol 4-phosphate cytidylyltransferase [Desulfobacterota bacterium]|nr:2-C-methyl-D-erythritol 4-phosphate cytidylyltransferase [Thermodesulfobacteriota bacterium]